MRAFETRPKVVLRNIEIGLCVVMGLQVQCKDTRGSTLNQLFIHYHLICVGPSMQ